MTTTAGTEPATDTGPVRLPITESQKGLLVVNERSPGRAVYNQLVRFDIDPSIPDETIERALATVVAVQPAMRQVFGLLPEMHARLTPPPGPEDFPLERVTAQLRDFEEAVGAAQRRIGRPEFDLANGPAYRFAVVRCVDEPRVAVLLCDHHIILDGVSMGPLVRDLQEALSGRLAGAEAEQRRVAREKAFVKELAAQNRTATSDRVVDRSREWAARLREVPPLVLAPLPGRAAQTEFTGDRVSWYLSAAETAALSETCRRLEISPFVFFSGIYGTVLARHGNVSSVLVGSPFMARRTIGAFDLGGFFVNTLPVTVDVEWSRTVDEHLGKVVRESIDFCRANVDVTFNRLVADVRPDRSSNRNPLFSAMLAMQDTFTPEPGGAVLRVLEPGNGTAKFDLWLGATPVDGRWLLELEYDRQLIAPVVADGLLTSLRDAVRGAVRDGSQRLGDLFADASAAASVRSDGWTSPLTGDTPWDWVTAAARQRPDAPAIEDPTRRLDYRQLLAEAERISAGLAAHGVGPRAVVGLAATTLCDTVTAILAILRRGAAYLPLDPGLPAERLEYMVRRAGCEFVVGEALVPDVPTVAVADLAATTEPVPDPLADPDAPIYVMYTSGSTGQPKGVQMGHRPLANLTSWQIAALGMDAETRFLQYAPLGFDVSFQEILPTLAAGGTVVSREPADRRMFTAVLSRIARTEVTHVYLPVAALRPLVQTAASRGTRLPALRYLCVSGEQLIVDDEIRDFFLAHPHCTLVNLYGPTETHAVTSHRLSYRDAVWPTHVPIGQPYPRVSAYVVDATGHLAPPGVAGELLLGGDCPADGYINDPEITAERFVPDRFSGAPDATMYRTGDLVVRDDRGDLVFLGRMDTQVKIRGYRIELGEIEAVANQVDGVRQSVAVVRGAGADRELGLFVRPDTDSTVDPEQVRQRLTTALPVYMRPLWIFPVDRVPTTPTGKTDRDALLRLADELLVEQQSADSTEVAYADDLERELAGLWGGVLDVEGIRPDRPLIEYGAHSLNIFTTLAEVQERYGVAVPLVDFFAAPTVATLAGLVRTGRGGDDAAVTP
ncbi:amino acid adenylation domain-containing protein [Micromonospora sp. DSM 115977]|uniref:Amino acid adenylation domain-containing protein n=1 Tax=Micromonospora reichwaldensis TaxID=3075516 RepID=A0ABU2WR16_9ACTN|nr:amino acid adenylation domain-containing protein [Micromonospora sp. DSM 115977]MDT0528306.1 amino acid adenylation domain-containing protein [Micromonospora sp. DSM 115977]